MNQSINLEEILESCCIKRKFPDEEILASKKRITKYRIDIKNEDAQFLRKCCFDELINLEIKLEISLKFISDKSISFILIENCGEALGSKVESEIGNLISQKKEKTITVNSVGAHYLFGNIFFKTLINELQRETSTIIIPKKELNQVENFFNNYYNSDQDQEIKRNLSGQNCVSKIICIKKSIFVVVEIGCITKSKSDVILNTTGEKLDFGGKLSRTIISKAGKSIVQECKKFMLLNKHHFLIKTTAGKLKDSKFILHALLSSNIDEKKIGEIIDKSLEMLVEHELFTISFPLIKCGRITYPFGKIMLERIISFSTKYENSKNLIVKIVLNSTNINEVQKDLNEIFDEFSFKQEQELKKSNIDFSFIYKSSSDIEMIIDKLKNQVFGNLIELKVITYEEEPDIFSLKTEDLLKLSRKFPEIEIIRETTQLSILGPKEIIYYFILELKDIIIINSKNNQKIIPINWNETNPRNIDDLILLDNKSNEYQSVMHDFVSKLNGKADNIMIYRNQNYNLYHMYHYFRKNLIDKNGHANEMDLYHGTDENSALKICFNGFNRSLCGKNGVIYGQGVYFARLSSTSRIYSRGVKKTIIRAKVSVGRSCIGNSTMKTPPHQPNTSIPYDSTTDTNRNIFVCYNDNQCYPEYLIFFE